MPDDALLDAALPLTALFGSFAASLSVTACVGDDFEAPSVPFFAAVSAVFAAVDVSDCAALVALPLEDESLASGFFLAPDDAFSVERAFLPAWSSAGADPLVVGASSVVLCCASRSSVSADAEASAAVDDGSSRGDSASRWDSADSTVPNDPPEESASALEAGAACGAGAGANGMAGGCIENPGYDRGDYWRTTIRSTSWAALSGGIA